MSHPFDATLKEVIAQHPGDYVEVFNLPRHAVAKPLNVDLSTLSAATDVAFGFGQPIEEIVDLNFQSGPDPELPARLLLYNAAFRLRFRAPVRSLAILLRPKAEVDGLDEKLTYASGGKRLQFEYGVERLWKRPVDPFLQGGFGLLPLAPLCKVPEYRPLEEVLREVVREIDRRLAQMPDHAQAVRMMTAAYILTGLRVEKDQLGVIYDGVRIMHDSSAYELILDEGEVRGKVKLLVRMGSKHFGPPDSATKLALDSIQDTDRLDRIFDALDAAGSWQDLLATP